MKITGIVIVFTICLLVAGCSKTSQTAGDVVVPQGQVEQLQDGSDALGADPGEESSEWEESDPGLSQESAGTTADDLSTLESSVDDIVAKVDAAAPTGDALADRSAFRELHLALEDVESQINRMEATVEADVRSGTISRSDYLAIESRLDEFDDRLDRAEDRLEFTFAMDS